MESDRQRERERTQAVEGQKERNLRSLQYKKMLKQGLKLI